MVLVEHRIQPSDERSGRAPGGEVEELKVVVALEGLVPSETEALRVLVVEGDAEVDDGALPAFIIIDGLGGHIESDGINRVEAQHDAQFALHTVFEERTVKNTSEL